MAGEKFTGLDAVSFYDVNYDDNTDIVTIQTYGNTSFAAVYYGNKEGDDISFLSQEELSENISGQLETLTVSEVRNLLSDGKKNGEFTSYQEAYEARAELCELEALTAGDTTEIEYDLIYFNDDDIPELVAGVNGYYTSMYTYNDGKIYTLMDCWSYGAGGNTGYEYSPKKNSLKNYNTDYAGLVLYTTYMAISDQYSMDMVTEIITYNFDDVNGNGSPDEDEMGSVGYYGVSYINGVEATPEECAAADAGEYEPISASMTVEELMEKLSMY